MPLVSVTRLRVRSIRFLPAFALHFLRARRQILSAPGFIEGAVLPDRAWTFWTLTAWDGQESMRGYMTSGAHMTVMPRLLDWCDEASVVHWDREEAGLPSWKEACTRMRRDGRPSSVRNPSPRHAGLNFPQPRAILAAPLQPRRR
ncbi:MAG TPA: DUF3291 domain-containing protein [Stellaceae bacterium]|jgi:hypothetical protein|nr:DUF3291 domain-containing protein [Stellaceae bacterium]